MDKLKKITVMLLAFLLFFNVTVVYADEPSEDVIDKNIVTEYNHSELTDPVIIDVTETVAGVGTQLEIPAKSCILMDVATGTVLYEKESHMKLPPASITKVMALLLVMEAIDSGQLTLDTVLQASPHACSMGGSQIWLEPGEQMSVHDLLKAAVIGSANDATVVLGEAIAGSEEGFVAMMNERARELGLNDTTFINCTGLDADGHVTSAYDIGVMSKELIKHDLIKNYSTVWMDSLRGGESELVNTNKLVHYYEGCTGLKTGTTSAAGSCLTATAERKGMEIVAVVMGASNSNDRFNGARKLLDYGFANWTNVTVTTDAEALADISVSEGTLKYVTPVCNESKTFLVEKSKVNTITKVTELSTELKAPISQGQQIGVTRVFLGETEIGTLKITAANAVEKATLGFAFVTLLKNCFKIS